MQPSAKPSLPKVRRRSDHFDSPWREAMHGFFRSFLEFFFPEAHADIVWEDGFEILETELRQIAGKSRASPIRSDSLFRVRRLSGARQLLLIHAEVQTTRDGKLAERMFRYNYRSYDAQGLEVASFAILGDASPDWRPGAFGWNLWGCRMGIDFPSVKLIDYLGREEELAASRNPFALMTQAFLSTRATRDDGERRRIWKLRLVRRLYEQQYTAEEVRRLFRVIDWMMQLEPEQAIIFKDELEQLEAEKAMQYVTSVERIAKEQGLEQGLEQGIEQGIEQGLEQGLQRGRQAMSSLLRQLLSQRFGQLPEWVAARLQAASVETLEAWGRRIFEARSLEEIFV